MTGHQPYSSEHQKATAVHCISAGFTQLCWCYHPHTFKRSSDLQYAEFCVRFMFLNHTHTTSQEDFELSDDRVCSSTYWISDYIEEEENDKYFLSNHNIARCF